MASSDPGFTAIVLAAQRGGRLDPLAAEAGVSHKCLVPIEGRPLIAHVLDALRATPGLDRIVVSVEGDAADALRGVAGTGADIAFSPAASNIADSVYAAAQGARGRIVVTTADNVLLTPHAVAQMLGALEKGAEVVVALARREDVLAAHPEGQRRFYKFADGSYSNCNLYGFADAGALRLAETFRTGGQFSKNPMRIVMAVGLFNLLILRTGLLSLGRAMRRLSRRFGIRAEPLILADGAHAVDVDNSRTFSIAEALLRRRSGSQGH
jgi:CTP:molybdopterin cytidylyltransferase MocA